MNTNPTNEYREQAREPIHVAECAWQRTTSAECEYRETHHYCPHPEHACTCPPRTKPFVQHLDERMISADDVLGFLLAAEEGDEEDMTDRGVQASVRMLLEIAKRRKETGALYTNRATEQPPERLYVRLTAIGGTISHVHDPRQAYGKNVPVYEYVPASALSSRDAERFVVCGDGNQVGGCGDQVSVADGFRCADCLTWFHRDCINQHFELDAYVKKLRELRAQGAIDDWKAEISAAQEALVSRDAEVREVLEGLAKRFDHAAWKGFNQSASEFENGYKHAMSVAARVVRELDLYAKLQPLQSENPGDSLRE